MTNKLKKESGFTLVETFVAITILIIAVLGPMTLLSRALQDSRYVGDTITATYLAQEGVELVIDDRNKSGDPLADVSTLNLSCTLNRSDSSGYSCQSGGEKTKFSRKVGVSNLYNGISLPTGQYLVTSTVSFPGLSNPIVAYSIIFKY